MKLNRLTEHIYWLPPDDSTDRPVLGVIVGTKGTLIVDAGNSPAHALLLMDEMAKHELPPPQYVALTHWHWDHVFGTDVFDVPILATHETKRIVDEMVQMDWSDEALDTRVTAGIEIEFCRDMIKKELPDRSSLSLRSPDMTFGDQLNIDMGTVTCQIIHVGGDHAGDSCLVFIPEEKAVFLGDCAYVDLYSGPHSYTTAKLFPLLDQLIGLDAEHYLLGHDSAPLSFGELEQFAAKLKLIGRLVGKHGDQRDVILVELQAALSSTASEEDIEMVDAFIVGLLKE